MSDKPILMTGDMVRAILEGRKTQTRRPIKPQPQIVTAVYPDGSIETNLLFRRGDQRIHCPYGVPGDRLWVRETWQYADWTEDGEPYIRYEADGTVRLIDHGRYDEAWGERLVDIWAQLSDHSNYRIDGRAADRRWRPSIHMPRWVSRLTLEITSMDAVSLQPMFVHDARAEGVDCGDDNDDNQIMGRHPFVERWDSINAKRGYGWEVNPWVWSVSFKVVTPYCKEDEHE